MADLPPGARQPEDDNVDVESRLAGAMVPAGEGRRPVTLSEALYERIVDVTRQEVSTAVEVLGTVVAQVGRLERRINALVELVDERAAGPGGGDAGVAELREVVARIDRRVEESSVAAAGAAGRLNGLVAQLREEIGRERDVAPLTRGLAELREAVEALQAGDVGVVQRAVLDLRGAVDDLRRSGPSADLTAGLARLGDEVAGLRGQVGTAQPDLGPLDARLDAIERSLDEVRMASGTPPDLSGMADTLATLRGQLDEMRTQIGAAGADLAPVNETLTQVYGRLSALDASRDDAVSAVAERFDRLHATIEEVRAAQGQATVDLGPVTEAVGRVRDDVLAAVEGVRAGATEAVGERLDALRDAVEGARADLAAGVGAPELAPVTDRLADLGREVAELRADVTAARPDLTPVTEALGALRAGFSDDLDGVLAAVDQARAAAATPDLSTVTDRLAELREAVAGVNPDLGPLAERLDALAASLAETREAAAQPDLTPVLDAIDRLHVGVADARPDLAPVTERLDALHGAVAEAREAAATPPDLSAVSQAVADLRAAIADDHEGVVAQVELLMAPVAPLAAVGDETRARLDTLAATLDEQAAALARLGEAQSEEAARAAERAAGVEEAVLAAVGTAAQPVSETVAGLVRVVDDLARQAVAIRTRVEGLDPAGAQQDVLARLDAMQSRLDAAALDEQDGRLREVRTVLAALVSEIVNLRESGEGEEPVATQVAAEAEAIRAALDRTRQETGARVSALQDLVAERVEALEQSVAQAAARLDDDRGAEGVRRVEEAVGRLREAVEGVAAGVAQAASAAEGAASASELTRAVNVITEVRWDMESTQERVLDVDRKIGALRSDIADTARMAHAGYQAAEAVAAGLTAVARLERRLDVELDGMGRQLDALAAAVELSVQARAERDRERDRTADRLAAQVSDRVRRYRELATDVRAAVREDLRRRKVLKERQRYGSAGAGAPAALDAASAEADGHPTNG